MNQLDDHPSSPAIFDARALGLRLRLIRIESFGADGVAALGLALGLPVQTWINYEAGVAIPGHVLLRFMDETRVEPAWLLSGQGERYRPGAGAADDRR